MIKHDYKPHNNKRFFEPRFYHRIPAWATHPFTIIAMAGLVMMLAILLSRDDQSETEIIEAHQPIVSKSEQEAQFDSGELELIDNNSVNESSIEKISKAVSDSSGYGSYSNSNYSDPIDIPLQLDSISIHKGSLKYETNDSKWTKESVLKGDNLSLIFQRIGLSPQIVYQISTLDDNTKKLRNLRPGEAIYYQLDKNKQLRELKYVMDLQNTLYIHSQQGEQESKYTYTSEITNKSIELRTAYVSGTITDSLYLSGKRAGLSDTLVINLANIFDWDIDFILDIRQGDSFSLLYQEKFLDGEKIGDGHIIAAEFINQGDSYRAVRYTDSKNNSSYYAPNGLSMRKAFKRAPIKFSYISSGFKPRRFHPILKRWKAHRGIDYRANTGTPIRATGDGRVTHSSRNKYNGKYVFIQHGQGIVTKYLHMSRRAVSRGKKVKQGQVIGYVGMTGLSEAPHLHYEFLVNGVHRNPRTVKLPKAEPIPKSEKANFLIESKALVSQLETRKHIQTIALMSP
ncbi:MAG: peptidoglycan DD-metalloendopeptidase family protein [Kangiellaceae bacterium]|nr:peptidoglycan DD-metalloendopeptidase family protein [Kangiellaceae bacterium]